MSQVILTILNIYKSQHPCQTNNTTLVNVFEDITFNMDLGRRRMEDEVAATQAALEAVENDSLLSPAFSSR